MRTAVPGLDVESTRGAMGIRPRYWCPSRFLRQSRSVRRTVRARVRQYRERPDSILGWRHRTTPSRLYLPSTNFPPISQLADYRESMPIIRVPAQSMREALQAVTLRSPQRRRGLRAADRTHFASRYRENYFGAYLPNFVQAICLAISLMTMCKIDRRHRDSPAIVADKWGLAWTISSLVASTSA